MLLDAYIRVSSVRGRVGENFISPTAQREQIQAWAALHAVGIGEIYEELDESGASRSRPLLLSALERVESGDSDGMVVAKLDRFGRSLIDGLANIERIDAAHGIFVSVAEGLDISTPTGKLILRIMLSMAEWELDRIRSNWAIARSRAIARGIHLGSVPVGYLRDADNRLVVDEAVDPIIMELFRRRALGSSYRELAAFLEDSGVPTAHGGQLFAPETIARMVHNRTYLGEVRSGPYVHAAAHVPIVDLATWQQAQTPPTLRGRPVANYLGGLLRCASCGLAMYTKVTLKSKNQTESYRCPGTTSAGRCPAPASVRAEEIEPLLEEYAMRAIGLGSPTKNSGNLAKCESDLERAISRLERYRDDLRLHETLGADRFAAGLAKRQRVLDNSALLMAAARRRSEPLDGPTVEQLEEHWPLMTVEARRRTLGRSIECVFIDAEDSDLMLRANVCTPGGAPIDIPRRGRPIGRLRPFDQTTATTVRLRPARRWTRRRVEKELRVFLDGKEHWPGYTAFARSGRSRLHHQMMLWGGPYHWAPLLDLQLGRRAVHWNEMRIHAALLPFLRGRESWPTNQEFRQAGLGSVRAAAARHGGIEHWAGIFELHITKFGNREWTTEKIEHDLPAFVAERRRYPATTEFFETGRTPLYNAICRTGGHKAWKRRLPDLTRPG